jgi:predicted RNase H-like HicB family nuclease
MQCNCVPGISTRSSMRRRPFRFVDGGATFTRFALVGLLQAQRRYSDDATPFSTDVTVVYEPDDNGWTKATLPALPSVITAGASRKDAREMVVDALMDILAIEPATQDCTDHERVRLDGSVGRVTDRELGRER